MWLLVLSLLSLSAPTLELSVERLGTPDAALLVRVRNGAAHRPIGFLREFWKHEAVQCTLLRDDEPIPYAFALRPDRPTLAQLVILEPRAEYGERLSIAQVWGAPAATPGSYRAECHVGTRADAAKLYESSIAGGARRAGPGLLADLKRVDFALSDLRPATLEFAVK
jgi:hypothetical protein